jgi:16S rRNA (guanine966-N2)-methyltransferase
VIRITGGDFRNRRLVVPDGIRPTTDVARKAVFDMLAARGGFDGGPVADLAAGSGAYGLEALSRGAASATFVDTSAESILANRSNVERLGVTARCLVVRESVRAFGLRTLAGGAQYPVVFHDPPYADESGDDVRLALSLLAPGGILVHERGDRHPPFGGDPAPAAIRRYGATWIVIYARAD